MGNSTHGHSSHMLHGPGVARLCRRGLSPSVGQVLVQGCSHCSHCSQCYGPYDGYYCGYYCGYCGYYCGYYGYYCGCYYGYYYYATYNGGWKLQRRMVPTTEDGTYN